MLDIGRVVKPHGLRGAVTVELWTNREERMALGAELTLDDRILRVAASSRQPDVGGRSRWMVTFDGVATREQAEAIRGGVLQAEALEVEGALWIHELVGAEVVDPDGDGVGRVASVEANPASDLLILEDGRLIPLTFVAPGGDGRLVVDGPPGLLDL